MRHITGIPRQQLVLFPESLDEYISADNPVQFIDAFVDSLDVAAAGFTMQHWPRRVARPMRRVTC